MKYFLCNRCQILWLLAAIFFVTQSFANVLISGTRLIYRSDAEDISTILNNTGSLPVLIQNWIDDGDSEAKPSSIHVPFLLSPQMSRVGAGKNQLLRIRYLGSNLPMDKESIFWLNVLEIPSKKVSKADKNSPQLAIRSRIKLFYRPIGLEREGDANDAAKAVTWNLVGAGIRASNPTPFYVSFAVLQINGKEIEGDIVPPRGTIIFNFHGAKGDKITGKFVNDYGEAKLFNAAIK